MAANSIFISYRRDDSKAESGRIYDRLGAEFGEPAIFFDIEASHYGQDFRRHVVEVLQSCRVCLVVIGPRWTKLTGEDGRRRLDDPEDLVRIEVETALARKDDGLSVIPLLLDDAAMPREQDLPASLAALPYLAALTVSSGKHFQHDVGSLINKLRRIDGLQRADAEPATAAGRAWAKIRNSTDLDDLQRFADSFPGTEEGLEARRRIDWLKKAAAAWTMVKWGDLGSVGEFVRAWPEHPRMAEAKAVQARLIVQAAEAKKRIEAKAAQDKADADAKAAGVAAGGEAAKPDRNIAGGVYFWVMFFAAALTIGWILERIFAAMG